MMILFAILATLAFVILMSIVAYDIYTDRYRKQNRYTVTKPKDINHD